MATGPPGRYLSGSLFLRSNIDFHVQAGAVVKGSPDPADYNAADVAPQNGASPRTGDNTSGGHLFLCIAQTNVTLRGAESEGAGKRQTNRVRK